MNKGYREVLVRTADEYPSAQLHDHRLQQYKLYVEMADRISQRRQAANSFFLTLNAALVTLVGYLGLGATDDVVQYGPVAIVGMVLSFVWYRLIRSYKDLNTAKFKVVHEMEAFLPFAVYDAEWEAIGRGKAPKLYLPFAYIEVWVPWVFFAIHAFVASRCIPWETVTSWVAR